VTVCGVVAMQQLSSGSRRLDAPDNGICAEGTTQGSRRRKEARVHVPDRLIKPR
jgi:hypothetical protein